MSQSNHIISVSQPPYALFIPFLKNAREMKTIWSFLWSTTCIYIYLHIRHFMPLPWSHDMSWWAMRAHDGRAFMRARVRRAYMRVDTGRAGSLSIVWGTCAHITGAQQTAGIYRRHARTRRRARIHAGKLRASARRYLTRRHVCMGQSGAHARKSPARSNAQQTTGISGDAPWTMKQATPWYAAHICA